MSQCCTDNPKNEQNEECVRRPEGTSRCQEEGWQEDDSGSPVLIQTDHQAGIGSPKPAVRDGKQRECGS